MCSLHGAFCKSHLLMSEPPSLLREQLETLRGKNSHGVACVTPVVVPFAVFL